MESGEDMITGLMEQIKPENKRLYDTTRYPLHAYQTLASNIRHLLMQEGKLTMVDGERRVQDRMTLTAPGCPSAQALPLEVERKVRDVEGVADAFVEVVWDPPWSADRMSDAAKLQLGLL